MSAQVQLVSGDGGRRIERVVQLVVRQQLEHTSGEELKQRLQQTQQDAIRLEKQLKELLHQRGELTQQVKTLVQDRQLPQAHIQLAIIERKLSDGLSRWKELSATTNLLRRVYKRYEKDRQPEKLPQKDFESICLLLSMQSQEY